MMQTNPIVVTSGEPAGIGPDLCLELAKETVPIVVIGNRALLEERAKLLGRDIIFDDYQIGKPLHCAHNHLTILSLPYAVPVIPGQLNSLNSHYVYSMLQLAAERCLSGEFSAVVTAPVHKGVINQAGIAFTGHTEFFAEQCQINTVVMMLACEAIKVALVTTHLPLLAVPHAITHTLLIEIITILNKSLQQDFAIPNPRICVAGLNPHAGEGGYLGREEIDVIIPALEELKAQGVNVEGPFSADTMFTAQHACDVFVAMYHDQGLPVLKYAGFGNAVNVTLGLPIIRTSVDHGTALELAGTGRADSGSLLAALKTALTMVENRQ